MFQSGPAAGNVLACQWILLANHMATPKQFLCRSDPAADKALLSSVYYAVKAVVDPTILPNSGLARPITVTAPPGTVMRSSPIWAPTVRL